MRGTCDGPAVALASLFSVNGILAEGIHVPFDATSSLLIVSGIDRLSSSSPTTHRLLVSNATNGRSGTAVGVRNFALAKRA